MIIPTAYAQESLISVQTDDNNYDEGDTIVISGMVTTIIGETPITLQLFSEGNLVEIAQITVAQDGTYSHTVLAEGPLWKESSTYIVRVSYGIGSIAETTFEYNANNIIIIPEYLIIQTDKEYYSHAELIMVTGQVENVSGFPITITVVSPLNSIVTILQLTVAEDGSFETTLDTTGAMWKYDGIYIIKVNYGSVEKSNSVKVELEGGVLFTPEYSTPETPIVEPEKLILTQNQLITINYEITHFEKKINNIQTTIDSQQERLDRAILNNYPDRIVKITANIEGMTALQNIYELLLNLTQNQIILYS